MKRGFIFISLIPVLFISIHSNGVNNNRRTLNPDVQAMASSITQNEAEKVLRTLVNFKSRFSTHSGCQEAVEWARDQFKLWGIDSVYLDKYNTTYAPNVVAIKKGTKQIQDSIFIIGAHIDAIGQNQNVAPGADDNGSGTTCVLLVAKAMSNYKFRNDIRFVLFTGEEQGCVGSKNYVSKHSSDKIKGVLINDMILWYKRGDTDFDIEAQSAYRWLGNFLATTARDYADLPTKVNNPSTCSSDHRPFEAAAIPVIRTLTAVRACQENPHYHQASDTVGASGMNLPMMTKAIKANTAAMALLAGLDETSAVSTDMPKGKAGGLSVVHNGVSLSVYMPVNNSTGTVMIYDFRGKLVYKNTVTDNILFINADNFTSGIYQIWFSSNRSTFSAKCVITR